MNQPHGPLGWRHVKLWGEFFALSWRLYPGRTALMLLFKTASISTVAAIALSLRAVVNGILEHDPWQAGIGAAFAALAYAVTAGLQGLEMIFAMLLVEPVAWLHLEPQIQRDVASLPGLEHLERSDFLDRLTVLDGAAWQLMHGKWNAVEVVFSALRLVLLLTLLGTVSPWLLLLLPFAAIPLWLDQRGRRGVIRTETGTAEQYRLQRHFFTLATEAAGGKEIRVAGGGPELARRQQTAWDEATRPRQKARFKAAYWKLAGWAIFTAGFTGGLALVVNLAASGHATPGDVVLAITVAVTLRDSIQMALMRASMAMNSAQVIEPYLWLREYLQEHSQAEGGSPVPATLGGGITFDNVTFTYPGTDRPAIAELNCHFPAGSVVAIVGEFGSGKTSLVKLLGKFYTPDSGRILVDGTELSELDTAAWRARTSAAFQDFGRFHIRFAEGIGLGDLAHRDDPEHIAEAIEAADAQTLVDRLPQGMDTQLGRMFDGIELSEGQWQKTALARASMRQQPLLFILDEPTASLDAPSENAILERYMQRARTLAARTGAITVIVSHRFSTVTGADQILVLDAGRLVEAGTHAELIELGGRYARLYGIQATAYAMT